MSGPPGPPGPPGTVIAVTGGAGGLAAQWEAAERLAGRLDALGDRLRSLARQGAAVAVDPDLVATAVVSATSCAVASAAVLEASGSALVGAVSFEADAVGVRSAVAGLRAADDAVAVGFDVLDYALVRAAATSVVTSPGALAAAVGAAALGGESLLTDHPALVEHAVNGGGGLLDALRTPLLPVVTTATTAAGAATLASAYGATRGVRVADHPARVGGSPPSSLHGLLSRLEEVAALSPEPHSRGNGTIAVQTLTSATGRRHVVYLPGTDRFERPPGGGSDVREMRTNLRLVAGQRDDYTTGVREAMREAGVRPGEPVLLVGHSQGGMAAAALAASPGPFAITDVVTAGSPTAQVDGYPRGTHVLSLEQRGDVVPQLDGSPDRDSLEQTTVLFDAHPGDGVLAHHDYATYLDGAALADASDDPSVTDALASLREHGFLGSDDDVRVDTRVLQITRVGS